MALEDLQSEYGPTNKRNQKGTGTILGANISPMENLLFSISLLSSISFPSFNKAKSTAELFDRIINSFFTVKIFCYF